MTISTSNEKKQVWLLYIKRIRDGKPKIFPIKVFTSKELCFAHYRGLWVPLENNYYYLKLEWAIRELTQFEEFFLHPIDFFDETDVPD